MKTSENLNDYDFKAMIKEFETASRHEEYLKKIKKKWSDENKKYNENIKQMREFQEETYQKKNKELVKRLKQKEKLLMTSLENNQKTRMKERQKAIETMVQREKIAREKVAKSMTKQEKDRCKLQLATQDKSNLFFIIFLYFL